LLVPTAKVVFTCALSSNSEPHQHSITALKFAAKIREAIVKRANKRINNSNMPRNASRD
jgi:hypothetical protein